MKKTIVQKHKKNFDTLMRAFKEGQVALMDCKLRGTGESVAVICAVQTAEDGAVEMVPFAGFFNGNPYDLLSPPNPDGDYHEEA